MFLDWAPRDRNVEADALADGRLEGFDPALRVGQDFQSLPWFVLDGLMSAGAAFHKEATAARATRKRAPACTKEKGRTRPLREREPW